MFYDLYNGVAFYHIIMFAVPSSFSDGFVILCKVRIDRDSSVPAATEQETDNSQT